MYELKIFKKIPSAFSTTFFSIFDSFFEKKKFNTPLKKNHFDCNQFYITRPVTFFNIYIYIIIFEHDTSKLNNEHEERLIDEYSQKSITSRVRPLLETFEKSRRDTDRERAEATLPAKRNAVQFQSLVELTNESKSPRDPVSRFRRYITLEGGTRRNRGIPRVAGLSFEEFPCGRPCGAIENTGGEPMPFEDPFPRSFPARYKSRDKSVSTKRPPLLAF